MPLSLTHDEKGAKLACKERKGKQEREHHEQFNHSENFEDSA